MCNPLKFLSSGPNSTTINKVISLTHAWNNYSILQCNRNFHSLAKHPRYKPSFQGMLLFSFNPESSKCTSPPLYVSKNRSQHLKHNPVVPEQSCFPHSMCTAMTFIFYKEGQACDLFIYNSSFSLCESSGLKRLGLTLFTENFRNVQGY